MSGFEIAKQPKEIIQLGLDLARKYSFTCGIHKEK